MTMNCLCGSPRGAGRCLFYPLLLKPQSCHACGLSQISSHLGSAPGLQTQLQGQSQGLGDKEKPGHEQDRVGTGSWLTCGLRGALEPCGPVNQNPPSFPQPPSAFPRGGRSQQPCSVPAAPALLRGIHGLRMMVK